MSVVPRLLANRPAHRAWGALVALAVGACAVAAYADEALDLETCEPFDTVFLVDWDEFRVQPLEVEPRKGFRKPASGDFEVLTIAKPPEKLTVEWPAVDRVLFFEERLRQEADAQIAAGEFDTAYRLLARLERRDAQWPRLERSFARLLRSEALSRFRGGENDYALALLMTLRDRSPRTAGLADAIDAVGGRMIGELWSERDYRGVRATIDQLKLLFEGLALKAPSEWEAKLEGAQESLFVQAKSQLDRGRFWEARQTALGAAELLPLGERGAALVRRIDAMTPAVRVGVFAGAPRQPAPVRVDRPATRRVGRLNAALLARLVAYRGRGGSYDSPLGRLRAGDDQRSLDLRVDPAVQERRPDAAYVIARELLRLAVDPPASYSAFSAVAEAISVPDPGVVRVTLVGPHINPPALLLGPMPDGLRQLVPAAWRDSQRGEREAVFERVGDGGEKGPRYLAERTYADAEAAIADLASGEIDVLARIPSWRLEGLRDNRSVRVGQYRTPTLHCLVVSPESPLVGERDTRRAFSYAMPRQYVVEDVLLAGSDTPGFVPISGPLPYGLSVSDPLRYAYNDTVRPHAHEPRLAALLIALTTALDQQGADPSGEEAEPAEEASLVVVHPPSPAARAACRAIADQLIGMGRSVELREIADETELTTMTDYDLRYAELRVDEPMTQVWEVLGPGGIAADCPATTLRTLEKVSYAGQGDDLTDALADLHEIARGDLFVIPLWQTVDHYAWRSNLEGLPNESIDLYETLPEWRVTARGGGR